MSAALLDGLRNDKLSLIILPTEDCNFRCTYCYEDFARGKMKPRVIENLKKFISNQKGLISDLNVEWFGGEPLMAYNIVIEILEHIKISLPDINFASSMTTNASLLDLVKAQRLSKLGMKAYQISLDGFGETHDKTRVKRNGGGTFDLIWNNLVNLQQSDIDFAIKLRIHYNPDTLREIPTLLKKLEKQFSMDSRFSIFLKAIGKYGGDGDDKIKTFSHDFQDIIETKFISSTKMQGQGGSRKASFENFPVCYACKPNNYVIRSNGMLSKCTVDLSDNKNIIGELLEDGTIAQDRKKLDFWMRGLFSGDKEQLLCPAHSKP